MSIYYPTPEKTAPIEIFINLIWEINFSLATSMAACQKIVYPSQPNWSTYEPNRMKINSLHHENDHQWNKNFKLNPSVTFFFFSCAFLLILFFLFYTVIQMNVKQRLSSKVSKEISICSMYFSVNLLFWLTIVTLLKRIFDLTLVNSKYVGITMFKQGTRIYSYRKPHEI